jgi:hypothetical protein
LRHTQKTCARRNADDGECKALEAREKGDERNFEATENRCEKYRRCDKYAHEAPEKKASFIAYVGKEGVCRLLCDRFCDLLAREYVDFVRAGDSRCQKQCYERETFIHA